eukprot:gene36161-15092_t
MPKAGATPLAVALAAVSPARAFPPAFSPAIFLSANLDEPQGLGYCIDVESGVAPTAADDLGRWTVTDAAGATVTSAPLWWDLGHHGAGASKKVFQIHDDHGRWCAAPRAAPAAAAALCAAVPLLAVFAQ